MRPAITTGARLWWGLPVALVLIWAGGAFVIAGFPGLPQPPAITLGALPVARFARDTASIITVGCVLVGGLLLGQGGAPRLLRWAAGWALAWLAALLVLFVLTVSDVLAVPLADAVRPSTFGPFLIDLVVGRVFLVQVVAVVVVAALATRPWDRVRAWTLTVLVLGAAATPAFLGHGGLSTTHTAATVSLALHIGAISAWVGGVAVMVAWVRLSPDSAAMLVPRFSLLALWCVIVTAETGLLNATLRVGTATALVGTLYGSLVLGKVALLGLLVRWGWLQRTRTLAPPEGGVSVTWLARLAGWEVLAMGAAVGVSVALSRIGPGAPNPSAESFLPLSVVILAIAIPLLLAVAAPPSARWADRLAQYPEVPAFVLLIVVADVAGLGILPALLGQQPGTVLGIVTLVAAGWLWAATAIRATTVSGIVIVMTCWPLVMWFASSRATVGAGWQVAAISLVLAETLLAWMVRRRNTARRIVAPPVVVSIG